MYRYAADSVNFQELDKFIVIADNITSFCPPTLVCCRKIFQVPSEASFHQTSAPALIRATRKPGAFRSLLMRKSGVPPSINQKVSGFPLLPQSNKYKANNTEKAKPVARRPLFSEHQYGDYGRVRK
jgi:hypothetical protein